MLRFTINEHLLAVYGPVTDRVGSRYPRAAYKPCVLRSIEIQRVTFTLIYDPRSKVGAITPEYYTIR